MEPLDPMKKISLALAALAFVALLATSALAKSGDNRSKGDRAQMMWQRSVERLSLTTEQQRQLHPVFTAHFEQMKANRKAARERFEALLTPAQRETLQQLVADRRGARHNGGASPQGGQAGPSNRQACPGNGECPPRGGASARQGKGPMAMSAALGLTDEQKAAMKKIREENRTQMRVQRQQFVSQVEAVLTPAQKTQFEEMISRRGGRDARQPNAPPAETSK